MRCSYDESLTILARLGNRFTDTARVVPKCATVHHDLKGIGIYRTATDAPIYGDCHCGRAVAAEDLCERVDRRIVSGNGFLDFVVPAEARVQFALNDVAPVRIRCKRPIATKIAGKSANNLATKEVVIRNGTDLEVELKSGAAAVQSHTLHGPRCPRQHHLLHNRALEHLECGHAVDGEGRGGVWPENIRATFLRATRASAGDVVHQLLRHLQRGAVGIVNRRKPSVRIKFGGKEGVGDECFTRLFRQFACRVRSGCVTNDDVSRSQGVEGNCVQHRDRGGAVVAQGGRVRQLASERLAGEGRDHSCIFRNRDEKIVYLRAVKRVPHRGHHGIASLHSLSNSTDGFVAKFAQIRVRPIPKRDQGRHFLG
mmetsp:Transcript_11195/g.28229  ORF Transcript_11195/g.28229 Transcript_11195/m.28229 type:complete len:369 (-) Transcript_11195:1286-2392(-)